MEFTAGDLNGASPKLKLSATGVKIGDGTEITSTGATGAALLATATTTAARTALGLGSLAVQDATTIKLVPQAAPTNPVEGWLYADPVTHGLFYYNGTAWIQPFFQGATGVGSGLDADLVRGTTPSGLGLSLLGVADAASGRTALGLGPVATVPSTPGTFGLTMLGTVDASAGRTALGLGSLALQNSTAITTPLGVPAGTAAFYYGLLDFYRGGKVMRFDPQVGGNGTRAGITTDQATLEFTAGDVNGAGPKLKLSATGVKIGDGTEITSTGVTGAALVATTTASAARAALGLGPLAIEQGTPGAFGLTMLGTADAPAGRAALGLGSLALQDSAAVAAGRLELVPQAAPPNPAEGWLYLDSTTHGLYYYNGTAWIQPYSNDTFTGVLPTVALNENVAGQKAAVALASYQDDPAHSLLSLGINLTSSPSGTTTIQSGLAWGLALENNFTNAQGGSNHEFYLMDGGSHRPFGVNWSQPVSGNVSIVAGNVSCPSPHGLTAGQQFQFSSLVGASGVSPGTDYFVLPGGLTATQFTFSTSQGGSANDGSATSGTWQRGGHGSAYFGVPALVSVSDYTNAAYGGMTFVVRNTKESNPAVLLIENSGAGVGKKALLQMGYPGLTLQYDPQNTGADEFNLKTIDTHVLWKDVGGHIGLGIDLNAGIELGAKVEVGGQFAVATGTEEAPTYTFHGDLDTGFYSIGANRVGVSLGGTQAAAFFDNIFDLFRGGKRIRFDPQVGGGGTRAGITTDQATLEFTAGNLNGSVPKFKLSATGVSIGGGTEIASSGATGAALVEAATPGSARTALGLGSLATQDSTAIQLVPQGAPANPVEGWIYADSTTHGLAYYNGTAWTQPYTSPAGLLAALQNIGGSGSGLDADLVRGTTPSVFGLALLGVADAGASRTALGLGSLALQDSMTIKLEPRGAPANPVEGWIYADSTTHGLTYYNGTAWTQPYTSPAGLLAALQSVGGSGSGLDADLVRGTTPSVFGLALLGVADAGAGRTALGLGPVATVQGIPGALGLTLLGTTDAAAGRTALGLGSLVTQSADAVAITGGTISGLGSLGVSTGPLLADSPVTLASAWNAPAVVFTALKIDVTDTTSAAGSLLQDWQVGGMSKLGLRKDGTLLGPTNTTELALEAGGFGRLSYAGLPVVSWNQTAGWMFGSSIPMSWNNDLILGRDGAATLQLGQDAATTIPQTLKAHDGVGTDKDGADVTLAGGSGTGTGRGGAVQTATALSGATGGTQGALSTRTYQSARPTILTDSAATTIASITLANGKHLGGRLLVTVAAEDTTDFQVHSATLVFSAVNQGGVVVANISAESSATDAFTAGTLTTAWTIVQNGAAVNIKCNAASSLTGAVLTCKWIADLNSNDPAVVTPQ
ncbi:MAG: hypothetical protein K8R23_01670 [Chthoniobacter sp.]|nr:hypothetical protein [Chthoniobacter sp.]